MPLEVKVESAIPVPIAPRTVSFRNSRRGVFFIESSWLMARNRVHPLNGLEKRLEARDDLTPSFVATGGSHAIAVIWFSCSEAGRAEEGPCGSHFLSATRSGRLCQSSDL